MTKNENEAKTLKKKSANFLYLAYWAKNHEQKLSLCCCYCI